MSYFRCQSLNDFPKLSNVSILLASFGLSKPTQGLSAAGLTITDLQAGLIALPPPRVPKGGFDVPGPAVNPGK